MLTKDKLVSKTLWINESLWEAVGIYAEMNHLRKSVVIREAVKESLMNKKME